MENKVILKNLSRSVVKDLKDAGIMVVKLDELNYEVDITLFNELYDVLNEHNLVFDEERAYIPIHYNTNVDGVMIECSLEKELKLSLKDTYGQDIINFLIDNEIFYLEDDLLCEISERNFICYTTITNPLDDDDYFHYNTQEIRKMKTHVPIVDTAQTLSTINGILYNLISLNEIDIYEVPECNPYLENKDYILMHKDYTFYVSTQTLLNIFNTKEYCSYQDLMYILKNKSIKSYNI